MGNGESVVYMYPSKIRFTHDSIQSNFSDGHSIPETFRQILWKKLTVEDLPLIEVMKYGGEWFVVRGNRRLFLFKELEKRGLLSQVKVQTRNFDQYLFQTQHTSSNKGKTVLIRGYGHHAVKQELDEIWSEYQRETYYSNQQRSQGSRRCRNRLPTDSNENTDLLLFKTEKQTTRQLNGGLR